MTEEYAIIISGNKQYRVQKGDVIDVELLDGQTGPIEFGKVLYSLSGSKAKVGTPTIDKALVRGEVVGEVRGPKVLNYKYKKRKNYRRKVGHRQDYTRVRITEIAV